MFTQIDLNGWIAAFNDPRLVPYGTYFFQVAQLYVLHNPGLDDMFEVVIQDTIGELHHTRGNLAPAVARQTLFENMNVWADTPVPGLMAIPLPAVGPALPVIPPPPALYTREKAQLARWRTRRTRERGMVLAAQARALNNWFHWVSSGPVPAVVPVHMQAHIPQSNEPFKPKQAWSATQKDIGWEVHGPKQNDFARWMNEGFGVPDQNSWMNCWECVLFTAFRAGLITAHRLGVVHDMATGVARGKHVRGAPGPGDAYYTVLNHALGFRESVPMVRNGGLIPQAGDTLFFDGNNHVAISLGRRWVGGQAEDRVMSLWHHNGGRNANLTLEDIPAWLLDDVRFAPCPF